MSKLLASEIKEHGFQHVLLTALLAALVQKEIADERIGLESGNKAYQLFLTSMSMCRTLVMEDVEFGPLFREALSGNLGDLNRLEKTERELWLRKLEQIDIHTLLALEEAKNEPGEGEGVGERDGTSV
jgi:hypothetical protein